MSILKHATTALVPWGDRIVTMLGLPAGAALYRVFRHPGADWEPPPEAFRNGRLDPPPGRKGDYSILYAAESPVTAAVEARALRVMERDDYAALQLTEVRDGLPARQLVVLTLATPALFIDLEQPQTAASFGLDPNMVLDRVDAWQAAGAAVWDALASAPPASVAEVAGICYQSKHRGSNGWNFGFFHGRHINLLHRGKPTPFQWQDSGPDRPGS